MSADMALEAAAPGSPEAVYVKQEPPKEAEWRRREARDSAPAAPVENRWWHRGPTSQANKMLSSEKKKRGSNYTRHEKEHFLGLVKQFIDVIESKESTSVAAAFNRRAVGGDRSPAQLRHLYENIKQRCKYKGQELGDPAEVREILLQTYRMNQVNMEVLQLKRKQLERCLANGS